MKGKVVAIVPSAGIGSRFGEQANKPFLWLGNKPLIIWVLDTFEGMPEIHEIIPVLREADMERGAELFKKYNISKVKRIAHGGKERQDSVFRGLNLVDDQDSIVLIHDGVRPFVEAQNIRKALTQLNYCDGVVLGIPVKDTVKEVVGKTVKRTLKRETLLCIQTPQIFYYKTLHNAYVKALEDAFYSTDDSALVEKYGGRIEAVPGSQRNIKITTPEDLFMAEAFLKQQRNER